MRASILVSAALVAASTLPASAQVIYQNRHHDWVAMAIQIPDTDILICAATTYLRERPGYLSFTFTPIDGVYLVVVDPAATGPLGTVPVDIVIDETPFSPGSGFAGDGGAVWMKVIDARLVGAMMSGTSVTMTIPSGSYTFDLHGADAAIASFGVCGNALIEAEAS